MFSHVHSSVILSCVLKASRVHGGTYNVVLGRSFLIVILFWSFATRGGVGAEVRVGRGGVILDHSYIKLHLKSAVKAAAFVLTRWLRVRSTHSTHMTPFSPKLHTQREWFV